MQGKEVSNKNSNLEMSKQVKQKRVKSNNKIRKKNTLMFTLYQEMLNSSTNFKMKTPYHPAK